MEPPLPCKHAFDLKNPLYFEIKFLQPITRLDMFIANRFSFHQEKTLKKLTITNFESLTRLQSNTKNIS